MLGTLSKEGNALHAPWVWCSLAQLFSAQLRGMSHTPEHRAMHAQNAVRPCVAYVLHVSEKPLYRSMGREMHTTGAVEW